MIANKILVPVDFSGLNDSALAYATRLAVDTGAKLLIVHVDEPAAVYGGAGDAFDHSSIPHKTLQARLEAAVPNNPDVEYEHHLLSGDPAAEIVHFVEREGVDFIVMGTHGRSGLSRLLMGSVAEAIVRHAPCPVITLKHPVAEDDAGR